MTTSRDARQLKVQATKAEMQVEPLSKTEIKDLRDLFDALLDLNDQIKSVASMRPRNNPLSATGRSFIHVYESKRMEEYANSLIALTEATASLLHGQPVSYHTGSDLGGMYGPTEETYFLITKNDKDNFRVDETSIYTKADYHKTLKEHENILDIKRVPDEIKQQSRLFGSVSRLPYKI